MTHRLPVLAVALAVCSCVGLGPNGAKDEEAPEARVAILSVDGRSTRYLRRDIVRLSAQRYKLVPRSRYRRTARRLDAEGLTPADIAAVSEELKLDAIVAGALREVDGDYQLSVTIFSSDGEIADELSYELSSPKLRSRQRLALREDLYAALDEHAPSLGPGRKRGKRLADDAARQDEEELDDRRQRRAAERPTDSDRERRRRIREESLRRSERRSHRRMSRVEDEEPGDDEDLGDDIDRRRNRRSRDADRDRRRRDRDRLDADRERRERKRRDADRERRERERRDADRKRRERERQRRRREREEEERRRSFEPKHDSTGQAIDDEVPDAL